MENYKGPFTRTKNTDRPAGAGRYRVGSGNWSSFTRPPDSGSRVDERTVQTQDNPLWGYRTKFMRDHNRDNWYSRLWLRTYTDNIGGPFTRDAFTRTSSYPDNRLRTFDGLTTTEYSGPLYFQMSNTQMKNLLMKDLPWPDIASMEAEMLAQGASAIKLTNPMKSNNQILLSLAELYREGLPKMVGLSLIRNQNLKDFGHEYLNVEFGWAPLVSDIMSLSETVIKFNEQLAQLYFHNDKDLRRRFSFGTEKRNDRVSTPSTVSVLPGRPPMFRNQKTLAVLNFDRELTQETWFSGAFRYYVPGGDELDEFLARTSAEAAYLLGLRPSPELLWNLLPWSWLLDWFTNIGDVLSNISYIGQDGLVLRYGYIMRHTRISAVVSAQGDITPLGRSTPVTEHISLDRKARRSASPYGFGLPPSVFTQKQWSILGALGLTKAPERLR